MFEQSELPRVFGLPPGVDFPNALVAGLLKRTAGLPAEEVAKVSLVVNTRRMARRVTDLLTFSGARLLPRILTITDLERLPGSPLPNRTVTPLKRRLEVAQLVRKLVESDPNYGHPDSVFDLADGLATLIDEMHGEGVPVERVLNLDVADQSGHWARMQKFIGVAADYLRDSGQAPDMEAARRSLVLGMIDNWRASPPEDPILVAGSTGSRGTTAELMQAVASLPQGAVVLPGFDFDAPENVWLQLTDALSSEDHPQFRYARLMHKIHIHSGDVARWSDHLPASTERNRLVSLALRPAPFTDAWLEDGPSLRGLDEATENLTLIEAKTSREEAQTIALCLKTAAETGRRVALISPDRMLTRQVAAALDRWDIIPDDSAGLPLHLSPPGRFLRQVTDLFAAPVKIENMIALLKHPLTHSGGGRGDHLRRTRDLELFIRKEGVHTPAEMDLETVFSRGPEDSDWVLWVQELVIGGPTTGTRPIGQWARELIARSSAISAGSKTSEGMLWSESAGRKAREALEPLLSISARDFPLTAGEFGSVLLFLLQSDVVRDRDAPDGSIMIWGTLEARVQGADLVILGGLNDGSWPQSPAPDPWLNRVLRHRAGLLLPERRIGLSAHDWQQAICAPEVVLTRSTRSEDTETVPSRWLNRLFNLLSGLEKTGGPSVLASMRARGNDWIAQAQVLDRSKPCNPAPRPSPVPPVGARPRKLSVTEIKTLIRDPYSVYAKHILRLRPLNPLVASADFLLRGNVVHDVMEEFVARGAELDSHTFLKIAQKKLDADVPWPLARRLWFARLEKIADWFVSNEKHRRDMASPEALETPFSGVLPAFGFTLSGRADRIDRQKNGDYALIDYKTGTPPSIAEQSIFDKQLLLEAAILTLFGTKDLAAGNVADARFIGLGPSPKEVPAPLAENPPEAVWAEFETLVATYLSDGQGFTARRAVKRGGDKGDYDHLSRFGEWDQSDPSERCFVK